MESKSATKRLFIGFSVAADASLEAAIKRTRINADRKEMEFYWTPPANYHVTLCFLGPVAVEKISEIENALAAVALRHAPLSTKLRGMGGFPDIRHVRALYIGMRKSRALASMQVDLVQTLEPLGFKPEDREYTPHLTIGRLRKARTIADLISPYVRTSFGSAEVTRIVLYESLLHGGHPVYQPLASYELKGEPHEFTAELDAEEVTAQ